MNAKAVLSDRTIRGLIESGRLRIDPWDTGMLQPASVDLKLGNSFRVFHNHRIQTIDIARPPRALTELVTIAEDEEFVVHPGEFVLGTTAEWVELPDDLVARIEGKALALDTLVPTPEGWRTMGELAVGEHVFDPEGRPVPIVAATEAMDNRPCWEVTFSDGTSVIADGNHQWEVQTKYDRRVGRRRVLRTEELARSIWCSDSELAYHVAQAAAVDYGDRELPIDPYVLGVWIGDGTSAKAEVTCADGAILERIEASGYAVWKATAPLAYRIGGHSPGGSGRVRDSAGRFARDGSLSSRLRDLGLLRNKHIPRPYLEAGVAQRTALLEGLMDTDGYVDTLGRCDLTTTKEHLAREYCELVASLGHRPVVAEKRATLYGRDCGPKYEVTFTPGSRVFSLPRKAMRQDLMRKRYRSRGIRSVERVDSVPVRCIEVGTLRGTFLVTESFIPTHNSSLGRLGLIVHATAGFVDPGWQGRLTLEITNFNSVPIVLRTGFPIAQLSLMGLDAPAERPYGHAELGSHYHGQADATESRYEGGPGKPADPESTEKPAGHERTRPS